MKSDEKVYPMIKFMKYKWVYGVISSLILIPGVISLLMWGLTPSLDFTGGTIVELRFEKEITPQMLEKVAVEQQIEVVSVQKSADNTYLFKAKEFGKDKNEMLKKALTTQFGQVEELRFESVGPIIGQELTRKTIVAAGVAIFAILLYVAFAFRKVKGEIKSWRFGVAAVFALLHDTVATLGIFSLLGHFFGIEVDLLFVTAVLTIMSFSVHDTIVVFDRLREVLKRAPGIAVEEAANLALTETMTRSVNNSLTIIFMLLALFLLGGTTIHWFILALLIGTIFGTYSSPFVATPLLILFGKIPILKTKQK